MSEDRLNRLEEKLAFQEQHIQELNDTVIRQQHELDMLREHQQQLAERIRRVQEGHEEEQDEQPPHY